MGICSTSHFHFGWVVFSRNVGDKFWFSRALYSNEAKSSRSPIPDHLKQCQQQKEHPSFFNPEAAAGIRCSKEKEASCLPFLRRTGRRDPLAFNHPISYMGLLLLCFSTPAHNIFRGDTVNGHLTSTRE